MPGVGLGWVAIINRMVSEDLFEEVTFEPRQVSF